MHRFANPARFLRLARPLTGWLLGLGLLLTLIGTYGALRVMPDDFLQGDTARILHIHVPAAWLGMGGWTGLAICSVMQIVWRHPLAGVAARAIAPAGALFTFLCLATGSIWGRPTWGTWWEWDGRLTSMLILLFLYLGYMALASAEKERGPDARAAPVFGLVGAINLPIIHFSVQWWNTLHQGESIELTGTSVAPEMLWPLFFMLPGFSLLFGAAVLLRMRSELASARVEARLRKAVEA
jgi:heme exporter protein C